MRGYWVRAMRGSLSHFWVSKNRALCGKTKMRPNWRMAYDTYPKCALCKKRFDARKDKKGK